MSIKNIELRINFDDDSFIFFDQVLNYDEDKSGLCDQRGYFMKKDGSLVAILEERRDREVINPVELLKELKEGKFTVKIVDKNKYDEIICKI